MDAIGRILAAAASAGAVVVVGGGGLLPLAGASSTPAAALPTPPPRGGRPRPLPPSIPFIAGAGGATPLQIFYDGRDDGDEEEEDPSPSSNRGDDALRSARPPAAGAKAESAAAAKDGEEAPNEQRPVGAPADQRAAAFDESMRVQQARYDEAIRALRQKYDESVSASREIEEARDMLQKRVGELEETLQVKEAAASTRQIQEAGERMVGLEEQALRRERRLGAEIEALNQERESAEEEHASTIERLMKEAKGASAVTADLTSSLYAAREEISRIRQEREAAIASLESQSRTLSALRGELNSKTAAIDAIAASSAGMQSRYNDLMAQHDVVQRDNADLQARLEEAVAFAQSNMTQIQRERDEYCSELRSLKGELERTVRSHNEELKKLRSKHTKDMNATLQEQAALATKSLDDLKERLGYAAEESSDEIASLRQSLEEAERRIGALKAKHKAEKNRLREELESRGQVASDEKVKALQDELESVIAQKDEEAEAMKAEYEKKLRAAAQREAKARNYAKKLKASTADELKGIGAERAADRAQAEEETVRLEGRLARLRSTAEARCLDLARRREEADAKASKLGRAMRAAKRERDEAREELERTRERLRSSTAALLEASNSREEAEGRAEMLSGEVAELEGRVGKMSASRDERLRSSTAALLEESNAREEAEKRAEMLSGAVAELRGKLEKILASRDDDAAVAAAAIGELRKQVEESKAEITRLRLEKERAEEEARSLGAEVARLESTVGTLAERRVGVEGRVAALLCVVSGMESKVRETLGARDAVAASANMLRKQVEASKTEIAQLASDKARADEKIKDLIARSERTDELVAALSSEKEELSAAREEIGGLLRNVTLEKDALSSNLGELSSELDEARAQLSAVRDIYRLVYSMGVSSAIERGNTIKEHLRIGKDDGAETTQLKATAESAQGEKHSDLLDLAKSEGSPEDAESRISIEAMTMNRADATSEEVQSAHERCEAELSEEGEVSTAREDIDRLFYSVGIPFVNERGNHYDAAPAVVDVNDAARLDKLKLLLGKGRGQVPIGLSHDALSENDRRIVVCWWRSLTAEEQKEEKEALAKALRAVKKSKEKKSAPGRHRLSLSSDSSSSNSRSPGTTKGRLHKTEEDEARMTQLKAAVSDQGEKDSDLVDIAKSEGSLTEAEGLLKAIAKGSGGGANDEVHKHREAELAELFQAYEDIDRLVFSMGIPLANDSALNDPAKSAVSLEEAGVYFETLKGDVNCEAQRPQLKTTLESLKGGKIGARQYQAKSKGKVEGAESRIEAMVKSSEGVNDKFQAVRGQRESEPSDVSKPRDMEGHIKSTTKEASVATGSDSTLVSIVQNVSDAGRGSFPYLVCICTALILKVAGIEPYASVVAASKTCNNIEPTVSLNLGVLQSLH